VSATTASRARTRTFPVIEIFGPTIQGEGPDAGMPCNFIRLGGCDYRCTWCDSMHAVDPALVREHAKRMTAERIVALLDELPGTADLVVISGGNPALHDLEDLVRLLKASGRIVSVETQGSRWRRWLESVHRLVVSPKPPSSGMATTEHMRAFWDFMARADAASKRPAIKVVVFDHVDFDWAVQLKLNLEASYEGLPFFVSAGTNVMGEDFPLRYQRQGICERYQWLCEHVAAEPAFADAKVLPQLHALAWGQEKGR
jgi:7-carboxy-7-deazaguanine synthase